jgi:hypothetical protein
VNLQPTTGPIKNELDTSIDTLGTYRTHFGSGGSATVPGLDYRVDVVSSRIDSFIDGAYQNLNAFSGQLNYRVSDSFKVFGAVEYNSDSGHAYWGTPLVTTAFAGPYAVKGVVAGTASNTSVCASIFGSRTNPSAKYSGTDKLAVGELSRLFKRRQERCCSRHPLSVKGGASD